MARSKLRSYQREIDAIVDEAAIKLAENVKEGGVIGGARYDRVFEEFYEKLASIIERRSIQNYRAGEEDVKKLIESYGAKNNMSLAQILSYSRSNRAALRAYLDRSVAGMTMSDRVWNVTKQLRSEFEFLVKTGINSGIPAAELSRDIRKFLKEPNRLYRRSDGRLSKAAAQYHPGRGVYRSSYKNAFRLARTETNMAFRTATFNKYQDLDFVVGIRISLSNNPNHCDFCEAMQGDYPKDFLFRGWHPSCRCRQTAILKTDAEFLANTKGSVNSIHEPPPQFKRYVRENPEKVRKTYFGLDNLQYL